MEKSDVRYNAYIDILKEELVPAMGCTEPIALAYAAAMARWVLGQVPEKVVIGASGSIIKNVKSVIVPNTDHLKGISAAAAAGIIAGDPDNELEVIAPGDTGADRRDEGIPGAGRDRGRARGQWDILDIIVTLTRASPTQRSALPITTPILF